MKLSRKAAAAVLAAALTLSLCVISALPGGQPRMDAMTYNIDTLPARDLRPVVDGPETEADYTPPAQAMIIIAMIRAPLLMILVCCIWAGFCTWISSLVRIENSYAWGLAGYTALIIVITIQPEPLLTPQFAVERCSEIVIGIVCAIMAACGPRRHLPG